MDLLQNVVDFFNTYVVENGINVGGENIPYMVILLLGVGLYLTARTGFVQLRRLAHGFAVTSGKYDDPDEPGDVSHFQALTTALSATVGIGNIAGVAIAIHLGGPGALFWMWVTAFSEVTLAQRYRDVGADVLHRAGAGAQVEADGGVLRAHAGVHGLLDGKRYSGEHGRRQRGDVLGRPGMDHGFRHRHHRRDGDPGGHHPHRAGDFDPGAAHGRDLRGRGALHHPDAHRRPDPVHLPTRPSIRRPAWRAPVRACSW